MTNPKIALTKEETYPLKGGSKVASVENKCDFEEEEKPKPSLTSRLMTMPNFTILIVLLALACIIGECIAHSQNEHHNAELKTDPSSLNILHHEHATINFSYIAPITEDFTIVLGAPAELKIEPDSLTFTSTQTSNILNVTGVAVTSRAFIEVKDCFTVNHGNCSSDFSNVFVTVKVAHSHFLSTLVEITGWVYFFAWSISFYPQIILNFQRKSVEGLNFDFLVLNIIGFFCYSVFNVMFYFDSEVQELYLDAEPRAQIPVLLNDVVFALHALLACIITGLQCFIYQRGNQRISYICMGWSSILILFSGGSLIATVFKAVNWLKFITLLSYVKMAVTLSKYMPQAILNYRRKSTVGWSIGNILLDFTGGSMDIVQMVLQGANTNDWTGFYGNVVKFGLGLVSMIFDILFIIQHYILYRHSENYVINHEQNESTETVVQDTNEEEEQAASFDNGVYH